MEEGTHNVPVNSITDELERYRNISFADFRSFLKRQKDKKADLPALARAFWIENEPRFPKLSKVAMIVLSASPSSSVIERYFSKISGLVTAKKNRISAQSLFELTSVHFAPKFLSTLKTVIQK